MRARYEKRPDWRGKLRWVPKRDSGGRTVWWISRISQIRWGEIWVGVPPGLKVFNEIKGAR